MDRARTLKPNHLWCSPEKWFHCSALLLSVETELVLCTSQDCRGLKWRSVWKPSWKWSALHRFLPVLFLLPPLCLEELCWHFSFLSCISGYSHRDHEMAQALGSTKKSWRGNKGALLGGVGEAISDGRHMQGRQGDHMQISGKPQQPRVPPVRTEDQHQLEWRGLESTAELHTNVPNDHRAKSVLSTELYT